MTDVKLTTVEIPFDLLINLSHSIEALKELSELTPADDPNHRLLKLVMSDCEKSATSLIAHFKAKPIVELVTN